MKTSYIVELDTAGQAELVIIDRMGVYDPYKGYSKTKEGLRKALLDAKIRSSRCR